MLRFIAICVFAGLLAACTAHSGSHAATATPAPASTNALAGTPMAAYGHALNKARGVQDSVNRQAKKQAAAIDQATGLH